MDIQQAKEIFLNDFICKALTDDDIECHGIPTHKCPEIRQLAVETLLERLEMVLTEELRHMKEDESFLEDKYLYLNCTICSIEIDVEKDDYYNCNKCDEVCCTDCYVYRPDIFGMKDMKDNNGDCWENCEVCTTCNEEFEMLDDEEKKKIMKVLLIDFHTDEADTDEEDSYEEDSDEEDSN